jgi:hypothetical protein
MFRYRMELCWDREDQVDVHPGGFLLSPIFFAVQVVVTRLWVVATRSRVGVTLGRSDVNLLLASVVTTTAVLLLELRCDKWYQSRIDRRTQA